MKKILFFSAFLVTGGFTWAQSAPEFEFLPIDSISVELATPPKDTEKIADLEIHSLSPNDIVVKWQRNVIQITPGCNTQVCDLNACYPQQFSTKNFTLSAGAEGPISVHFLNPANVFCQAIIRIDMWNIDIPDVIVPSWYIYNYGSSGVNDGLAIPSAKVYPNPTADYFSIEYVPGMKTVHLYDLSGREVRVFNAESAQSFRIDDQPTGQYVIMVQNANGKIIAAQQLEKL